MGELLALTVPQQKNKNKNKNKNKSIDLVSHCDNIVERI